MMGKTHQLIGVSLTAAGLLLAGIPPDSTAFGVGIGIGWVTSVLPDIDGDPNSGDPAVRKILGIGHKQTSRRVAWAGRKMIRAQNGAQFTLALTGFVAALVSKLLALIVNLFAELVGHRGLTHWGLTWLGITALLGGASSLYYDWLFRQSGYSPCTLLVLPFFVGYGSHIFCDMATRSGLKFFEPFSPRICHILPKRFCLITGGWPEYIFLATWMIIVTPLLFALAYLMKGASW